MRSLSGILTAMLLTGLAWASPALAQGYNIRAGDVLKIEVIEDPSMNRSVLVAPDGRISVPLAGTLQASGRSVDAIAAAIAGALAPSFTTSPNVFVSLERLAERRAGSGSAQAAGITVHVLGEAAKPGKHQMERGSTVLHLFSEMGGFGKFAATKRVQLRRGGTNYLLNYNQIESGVSSAGGTVLMDGDVLIIPQRKLFE